MNELALLLSNARPPLQAGAAEAIAHFEAMYPEQDPRWQFVSIAAFTPGYVAESIAWAAAAGLEVGQEAPRVIQATPHGPKVGAYPDGPIALWIVFANAQPGKDAEFNEWYDNRHIHDVVDLPGLISCQRYVVTPVNGSEPLPWAYLAVFELERARVEESMAELVARRGGERMPNPGYLASGALMTTYQPVD